jgi:hypothetical protein
VVSPASASQSADTQRKQKKQLQLSSPKRRISSLLINNKCQFSTKSTWINLMKNSFKNCCFNSRLWCNNSKLLLSQSSTSYHKNKSARAQPKDLLLLRRESRVNREQKISMVKDQSTWQLWQSVTFRLKTRVLLSVERPQRANKGSKRTTNGEKEPNLDKVLSPLCWTTFSQL